MRRLERLEPGQPIVFGGDRVTPVPAELAAAFRPGDRLVVVQETGDLLHVPAADHAAATHGGRRRRRRLRRPRTLLRRADQRLLRAVRRGASPTTTSPPRSSRPTKPTSRTAEAAGRSTTRLVMTPTMRDDMIPGLRGWRDAELRRDEPVERVDHEGWSVEARRAPLGVVGFVFEGRPNVFADATGVLRTGNTVVMRIGSDALGTAEAIVAHALDPALEAAGLPAGAVALVRSPARAAGWALFADPRLALAVARAPAPPSPSSVPSPARPGRPSASTARVAPGSSPVCTPTSTASGWPCCTRSTARCATRSTCAASRLLAPTCCRCSSTRSTKPPGAAGRRRGCTSSRRPTSWRSSGSGRTRPRCRSS